MQGGNGEEGSRGEPIVSSTEAFVPLLTALSDCVSAWVVCNRGRLGVRRRLCWRRNHPSSRPSAISSTSPTPKSMPPLHTYLPAPFTLPPSRSMRTPEGEDWLIERVHDSQGLVLARDSLSPSLSFLQQGGLGEAKARVQALSGSPASGLMRVQALSGSLGFLVWLYGILLGFALPRVGEI